MVSRCALLRTVLNPGPHTTASQTQLLVFNDKMYYTDSPTAHIDVMDFHSTDTLETICASRRQQIKCSEGYPPVPDGCVVDKEGYVWSALFGAGCVRRYNPETG